MDRRNADAVEDPLSAPGLQPPGAAIDLADGLADLALAVRELALRHQQLEKEWRRFGTVRKGLAGARPDGLAPPRPGSKQGR